MRKSFKKVLCAVMAASMVFSTPIATNVVAQAASGEEGACVVKDLTKTTELTDTVANGAWWTNSVIITDLRATLIVHWS